MNLRSASTFVLFGIFSLIIAPILRADGETQAALIHSGVSSTCIHPFARFDPATPPHVEPLTNRFILFRIRANPEYVSVRVFDLHLASPFVISWRLPNPAPFALYSSKRTSISPTPMNIQLAGCPWLPWDKNRWQRSREIEAKPSTLPQSLLKPSTRV